MAEAMKPRSGVITNGPDRAPSRAMLKAVGFTDEDLRRPIVGVANTWIEIGPCNYHLRRLAAKVKEGIRAAARQAGVELGSFEVVDHTRAGDYEMMVSLLHELRRGKGMTIDEARDQPDGHDHHGSEHEILDDRLEGAEPQVVDPLQKHVDLEEEVLRRDAERGQDDADDERQHQEPDKNAHGTAAQECLAVHGFLSSSPLPHRAQRTRA